MNDVNHFVYGLLVSAAMILMFTAGAAFVGIAIVFLVGVLLRLLDADLSMAIMLIMVISLMLTMGLTS